MKRSPGSAAVSSLPAKPISKLTDPFQRFLHVEAASGVVLLAAAGTALALANSPLAENFLAFWQMPVGLQVGTFEKTHTLKHWINDGLMTLFFFVVGLEVKREIVMGELKDLRTAVLPIVAALGGMVAPAAFYLALQWNQPGQRGWGIAMATDIAFVVGCLAVLGSRVPQGLRILLLSLAIADDIGAILVIAFGYTTGLNLAALAWGFVGIGGVIFLARAGVRGIPIYFIVGALIWFAFHESGIHPTIAGVLLGLLTPATSWVTPNLLRDMTHGFSEYLQGGGWITQEDPAILRKMEVAARESLSPLERLEASLHPWVSFLIMPLFAFANAGVPFQADDVGHPVAIAVMAGLFLGKPIGIVLFSWLAIRAGLAKLPQGVTWGILAAGGMLAGIGFTMALFIASLALEDEALNAAKVGILAASAAAAVIGVLLLYWLLPAPQAAGKQRHEAQVPA